MNLIDSKIVSKFFLVHVRVVVFFYFWAFSLNSSADVDSLLVDKVNSFVESGYGVDAPVTPVDLLVHWKQVESIDLMTTLFKSADSSLFNKTKAKPHMLYSWSNVKVSADLYNHSDVNVAVLAGMIKSYKYILAARLDDKNNYKSGEYSNVAAFVKHSGERLAALIDEKYSSGKTLSLVNKKNPFLQ